MHLQAVTCAVAAPRPTDWASVIAALQLAAAEADRQGIELKANGGSQRIIDRGEVAYKAMTRCIAVNRRRKRLSDLEQVFRFRFNLAPGLTNGAA